MFFCINAFTSSVSLLIGYAIILAVAYYIYYAKVQAPMQHKNPILLAKNRTRKQPLGYVLLVLTVLLLIASEVFNFMETWFWPMLLVLSLIDDGFSTPTNQQ